MRVNGILIALSLLAVGFTIGAGTRIAGAQDPPVSADPYAEMILVQQMMNGNDRKAIACKHPGFPGGMWTRGREADCANAKLTYDGSVERIRAIRQIFAQYVAATRS